MTELQSIWGWMPATYLFLGGLGAGTFLISSLTFLCTGTHRKAVCIGMWSAIVSLAVGLMLLLGEVSAPFRALKMWQSFSHFTSWMAVGAWLLFAGIVCFAVAAFSLTDKLTNWLKLPWKVMSKLAVIFSVIGAVIGACIALYTGILLMAAKGVPFWNTPLLPVLFTVSAIDTGVAAMAIIFAIVEPHAHIRFSLEILTMVLIVIEVCVLLLFVSYMLGGGNGFYETLEIGYQQRAIASAQLWLSGSLSFSFWILFVGLGLVVPFVLALAQCVAAIPFKIERILGIGAAACVLIGGCTLRFITLEAGVHVDVVAQAVSALL